MNEDGKIKIVTEINPDGANTGGDQVIQKVDQIEKKTEEAGEGFNTAVLGNLRSVHHLVGGLIELGEGGSAAIGGLAAEGRVATEVFEGMLGPLAPILLILTTVTQIAIPLFTKAIEEQKKKQDEANEALEKQNEKLDELKDKHVEESIKLEAEATEELAKQYKASNDELERRSKNAKADATNEEARIKAVKDLTLALLEQQKQSELSKAQDAGERKEIEDKYKIQEAQVEGASLAQIDLLKKSALDRETEFNNQQRSQTQGQINDLQGRLDDLKENAEKAAAKAEALGVEPDEAGSFSDAYKEERERNRAATKAYSEAQQSGASQYTLDALFDKIIETIPRVRAAFDADQAQQRAGGKEGKDLQTSIDDLSKKMDALVQTYRDLKSEAGTLAITAKTDAVKTSNDAAKAAQDAGTQKAKEDFNEREAGRYAQNKEQEKIIEDPNATDDAKAAAKAAQDRITAAGKQDQIDHAGALGLSPADITKLRADLALEQAKAADAIGAQQKKDIAAQQKAITKDLDDGVKEATRIIEQSGNKAAMEQFHAAIKSQVVDPLQRLADIVQILSAHGLTVSSRLAQAEADIERLKHP